MLNQQLQLKQLQILSEILKQLVDIVLHDKQIVKLFLVNEVIVLFGELQNILSIGEIVLGMLHNIKMYLGDEMLINGFLMLRQQEFLLEVVLDYEL